MKGTIVTLAIVAFELALMCVCVSAQAKEEPKPVHCTTVYVLGGTITTCK